MRRGEWGTKHVCRRPEGVLEQRADLRLCRQSSLLLVVVDLPGNSHVHGIPLSSFHCFRFSRLSQLLWSESG